MSAKSTRTKERLISLSSVGKITQQKITQNYPVTSSAVAILGLFFCISDREVSWSQGTPSEIKSRGAMPGSPKQHSVFSKLCAKMANFRPLELWRLNREIIHCALRGGNSSYKPLLIRPLSFLLQSLPDELPSVSRLELVPFQWF